MERIIEEITTEANANEGLRLFNMRSADAADELVLSLRVLRKEDTSLYDEAPKYEATGKLVFNGQLADELSHLVSRLNLARHTTRIC